MKLNKTARTNLMYIGIVILALMLIPLLKKVEFARGRRRRRGRGRNREREATVMRGTGVNESARSKARRKAKKCKYLSSPRARKKAGC